MRVSNAAKGAIVGAAEVCGPHAAVLNPPQSEFSSGHGSDAVTPAGRSASGTQPAAQDPAAVVQTLFAWSAPVSPHLTVQREGAIQRRLFMSIIAIYHCEWSQHNRADKVAKLS